MPQYDICSRESPVANVRFATPTLQDVAVAHVSLLHEGRMRATAVVGTMEIHQTFAARRAVC
ncbi:hypothetical protein CGMCC3_g3707 [Colletotrichum fructicola]|nr:uncharacterized protein CGMCC3_g3707 [Colletotrichum fructicola]KAE9580243.1 hypothetical protein CGMCC3_g3707 [Colletotrichum fructicola]